MRLGHARKSKMRVVFLFIFLVWPVTGTTQEAGTEYRSLKLTGNLAEGGRQRFELCVRCQPWKELNSEAKKLVSFEDTDGSEPWCVVTTLSLKLNGKSVAFPRKSYADRFDVSLPAGVYLTSASGLVVVHLRGADGAASWKARLETKGLRFVAREIEDIGENGELRIRRQLPADLK